MKTQIEYKGETGEIKSRDKILNSACKHSVVGYLHDPRVCEAMESEGLLYHSADMIDCESGNWRVWRATERGMQLWLTGK